MHRSAVSILVCVMLCPSACTKLDWSCTRVSQESTRSDARDELNRKLGLIPAEEGGRWGRLRAPVGANSTELETQIRQLEALGYASGTKTAPALAGVTRYDAARAHDGLNFYVSGHEAAAVLMRMDGEVLHRWARDFWDVWSDDRAERSDEGTHHWRHAEPFRNGDLLAIHEGLGLVKLDRFSNLIWARRNGAHHDFQVLPNGDIAVLAREARLIARIDVARPILEDFVLILDSNGREKQRISVLEAFERSPEHRGIWDDSPRRWGDLFHTNSIEVLDGRFAGINPAFTKGSFLLSSRHLNTVFVVSPDTRAVVWALRGAFKAQHDAHLLADGSLMLFDNSGRGRVSAVEVYDLKTLALQWAYAGSETQPFYTRFCGTSQRLPNGDTLITESDNGRAFEVTEDGDIVWEFYNPHRAGENDEFIAALFRMDRLPRDFTPWLESE